MRKSLLIVGAAVVVVVLVLLISSPEQETLDHATSAPSPSASGRHATDPGLSIEAQPEALDVPLRELGEVGGNALDSDLEAPATQSLEEKYANLTLEELIAARTGLIQEMSAASITEFERYIAKGKAEYVPMAEDGESVTIWEQCH